MWSVINYINGMMATIKQNPILAGIFAMWGATMVGYLLKSLPRNIASRCWEMSTISIQMDSDVGQRFDNGVITENFAQALGWISEHSIGHFTRNLRVHTTRFESGREVPKLGIGDGTHYVWWKGRLFIVNKGVKGEDKGRERLQYLHITMLGRDRAKLEAFVLAAVSRDVRVNDGPRVYKLEGSNWERQNGVLPRTLDSVFLDVNVKHTIKTHIEDFLSSREWYRKRHLAYKQSYLFYGEPGTGKTSLIRAIGHQYKLDTYIIDLATVSMRGLASALNDIRNASDRPVLIVFEDIDASGVVKSRTKQPRRVDPTADDYDDFLERHVTPNDDTDDNDVSLSDLLSADTNIGTLLNILDGVVPLDNVIFAMSTNHIEKIDTAILRPGRTDYKIEIPFLHDKEIKAYINYMYEINHAFEHTFMPIAGCQLELLFKQNKHSVNDLINALPTWESPKCLTIEATRLS